MLRTQLWNGVEIIAAEEVSYLSLPGSFCRAGIRNFNLQIDVQVGGHQGLRNSGIGKIFIPEYGILAIFRRNDGILHPCREQIFSKMIHWIRNFDKFYGLAKFFTYCLVKRKRSLVGFSSQQHQSFVSQEFGILVKNHRNGGFQLKIARNGAWAFTPLSLTFPP